MLKNVMDEKMKKKLIRIAQILIFLVPLLMGIIGYVRSGEGVTNAVYASFALYFVNPVSDGYNRWIEFARWTAPLVTATAILCVLKTVWQSVKWYLTLWVSKDSVAVYSNEDTKIKFASGTKAVYPGEKIQRMAKSHIIVFSSDDESLEFYEEHKEQLENKSVYIGLRNLELGSIKEIPQVTLFDVNGSIARLLWKKIALWEQDKKAFKIVVMGDGALAQSILATGLQWNLFSLEQRIEYDVISSDSLFQRKHENMPLMNADTIRYYGEEEDVVWNVITDADVVIVADTISIDQLQTLAVRVQHGKIYFYSPTESDISQYLIFDNLTAFGRNEDVWTDENIRRQKMIEKAILLNKKYAEQYNGEENWNLLTGFLKASNISSADFGEIITKLPEQISDKELAELEHMRWCRFHYLNYWKPGVPDNGDRKDLQKRIHKDLCPYRELDEEEKEKDLLTIRNWKKENHK